MQSYLLDTNIQLRLVQPASPQHPLIRAAADKLWERGAELVYTSQNLAEFRNVCTHPVHRNGFGFSIETANSFARQIESRFTILPDGPLIH